MTKITKYSKLYNNFLPICDACGQPITARKSSGHHAWAIYDSSKRELDTKTNIYTHPAEIYFAHHGACHLKIIKQIESQGGLVSDLELERFLLLMLRELAPTIENIQECFLFRVNGDGEGEEALYNKDELFYR